MKNVKLIALVFVTLSLLVVPLAWSQGGDVEQQIAALDDQVIQAYLKADTGFMEKYFADDYTAVHSDDKLTTKAQDIENCKSGALKHESMDVHERKIRAYGDTAVVIRRVSSKGTYGGKSFSADSRVTEFWVKQKGNWKIVAYQVTRVAPASQ